jgi:hypothetical protein
MLLHLIAFGIISTAGSIVTPGTGDVSAPAGQTAAARATSAESGISSGIPTTAFIWAQPLDPSDRNFYAQDWSAILGTEKIASIRSITMTALGVSLGVQVDSDSDRIPIIDLGGQKLGLWFKVDDTFKQNPAFSGVGTKVGISVLLRTDATPYKELERTWVLTVAQQ